jgi:hypothetical protein
MTPKLHLTFCELHYDESSNVTRFRTTFAPQLRADSLAQFTFRAKRSFPLEYHLFRKRDLSSKCSITSNNKEISLKMFSSDPQRTNNELEALLLTSVPSLQSLRTHLTTTTKFQDLNSKYKQIFLFFLLNYNSLNKNDFNFGVVVELYNIII